MQSAKIERRLAKQRDGKASHEVNEAFAKGRPMSKSGNLARDLAEQGKTRDEIMQQAGVSKATALRAIQWANDRHG